MPPEAYEAKDLFDFSGFLMPDKIVEKNIKCNKSLRVDLDKALQKLSALHPSDERQTAMIRLKETIMWLGQDLRRLNDQTPYTQSMNPDNADLAPTAEVYIKKNKGSIKIS